MTEPLDPIHIRVQDVHKSYGDNHVLRGVDLDIHRGKTNVVIGGSGAGKTVLLRQLIALERPDRGHILLDGQDLVSLSEVRLNRIRRRFGMVFQASALFDSMTVFENVAFPLREHTRLSGREIRKRVSAKLEVLGLAGTEARTPGEISGGMRKRVAVARALILEPEILIYDEPTAGLDPVASRNVDRLINDTAEHFRGTSVVISHDMNTTFGVGHYVALLHEGRIHASGRPAEIAASQDPVVRRFLAASGVTPVITHAQ
ncbi:MAG: ABC transporter ATP-binding protein [Deltaproteobacteria bacterium]|nr:ABC transporter ATP-binding protein [Deltaproteobacteria bacterium]